MAEIWRVIDTGLRPAAQNIALDRAMLEARRADEIPGTLRFARFPACALVGNRQSADQVLDIEHCGASGLEIQRRVTAGDVFLLDPGQLVWALYLHRRDIGDADLPAISRRLCHAAAAGVSALGLSAAWRAPGDIEVDGRIVSESAALFDGHALLFQGTLLLDLDPGLLQASRFWRATAGAGADRVAGLAGLLGRKPDPALVKRYFREAFESEFGVEFGDGEVGLTEHARYEAALREVGHPDWVNLVSRPAAALPVLEASREVSGTRLRVVVAFDGETRTLRRAWFATDVAVRPQRGLPDLEAALRDAPAGRVAQRIERYFAGARVETGPLRPADFVQVLERAIGNLLTTPLRENNGA